MTIEQALNLKLTAEDFKDVDILKVSSNEQVVGKPTKYWGDVAHRFVKNKAAVFFALLLLCIILMAIIIPLSNFNGAEQPIADLPSGISYLPPRFPGLMNGIQPSMVINADTHQELLQYESLGIWTNAVQLPNGSWEISNYNPYVIPGLKDVYPFMGTDGNGRDWWTMLWYSTAQSLTLAVVASLLCVIIGTIYGSIAGSVAGSWLDIVLMRIVEIISGVPIIVWVLIFALVFSGGSMTMLTVGVALVLTGWMWPAIIARTYIMKYKDSEFVQAARTLGASQARIIFSHLMPNVAGRLLVNFVNQIPSFIFFEASLVFLGLKGATDVSLGTMIDTAWKDNYAFLLYGPTIVIVLITLSAQIIANNINDSLDPRIVGS